MGSLGWIACWVAWPESVDELPGAPDRRIASLQAARLVTAPPAAGAHADAPSGVDGVPALTFAPAWLATEQAAPAPESGHC